MTNDLKIQYRELIALTELYLLENYSTKDRVFTDPKTFNFFKNESDQRKTRTQQTSQQAPTLRGGAVQASSIPVNSSPVRPPTTDLPPAAKSTLPPLPTQPSSGVHEMSKKLPLSDALNGTVVDKQQGKTDKKKSELFELDPILEVAATDLSEMRKIVTEKLPMQPILDDVPSDQEAKKINSAWQTEVFIPAVVILSCNEVSKQKAFLNNIVCAIQHNLAPAALFSAQKFELDGWNTLLQAKELRLIIASDYAIHALPGLMKHYREVQKQGKFYLDKVPLCLLSDVSLYFKEPHLKLPLWKAICDMLQKT